MSLIIGRAPSDSSGSTASGRRPLVRRRRAARLLFSLSLVACSAACGPSAPPPPPPPLPQVEGSLTVGGLSAPVRVVRDRWGVPHISAATADDLFFAQGFVQAQDRLFQMDLWRRASQGRLSEVLGSNFIDRDSMTRRVQYRGDLDAEWASYGPDTRAIATAFTNGINAWVAVAREQLPEEFLVAGWSPELWRPEDLLSRTDAFLTGGDAASEILRARLAAALGPRGADRLPPVAGAATPTPLPPGLEMASISPVIGDVLRRIGTAPFFSGLAGLPVVGRPDAASGPRAGGSNAWAVVPGRSRTGAALLAADPHRPLENPALRYLVHLQAPGWNVIGATAPWLPGVVIGHNDRVAWAMTAAPADTQDLFVERVNPANERQVWSGGRWVEMIAEPEAVTVRGREEPFEFERLYTPHGVVIALDRDRHFAYTLKWSGDEPGAAAELGALALARATTWEEFRAGLARWRMPVAEFVYADADGRVARQVAGAVPIRRAGNGAVPVPGWTGTYGWRGWRRLDELPRELDPASGTVISANGDRARLQRIAEVLADATVVDVGAFEALQHDVVSWNAGQLVPLLAGVRSDRGDVEEVRQRLLRWDRRMTVAAPEAGAYRRWERALARGLAEARIPTELVEEYLDRAGSAGLVPALVAPSERWFDGDVVGSRDALLVAALLRAVEEDAASAALEADVTFAHPLGISERSRSRFGVGPFAVPGYHATVLSVSRTRSGQSIGPSFRAIVDLGDWDRSVAINAPGQSGSPGSRHFDDLARTWAAGDYFPLAFGDAAVQEHAESTLLLMPR